MSITYPRRRALAILALFGVALAGMSACTPQYRAWCAFHPAECAARARAVEAYKARPKVRPSKDCVEAIHRHWPASSRATALRVMHRESGNRPAAANPSSSARGCMQLLSSLHSHRYTAVGCSPSQWANPDCNVKAAVHLFRAAGGWSPWALTV